MHGIGLVLDWFALFFLEGKTLNKHQLLEEIAQNENISCSESQLYQSMRRLRFCGFIKEVPSSGRDKQYRLTQKGSEVVKDFVKIFRGKA